jgi:PPOX class probable F420-dependent enzyme
MELSAAHDFVRAHRQGVLASLKRDGRPQLSNIVYAIDEDGTIEVSVTDTRAKTANIRRDPRVSLHVSREDFWAYAVIEGNAELTPVAAGPNDDTVNSLVDYYRRTVGEHPDWDDYRRAMVDDRRLILRIRPTHAYGMVG